MWSLGVAAARTSSAARCGLSVGPKPNCLGPMVSSRSVKSSIVVVLSAIFMRFAWSAMALAPGLPPCAAGLLRWMVRCARQLGLVSLQLIIQKLLLPAQSRIWVSPPLRTGSDRITADTLSCIAILEVSDRKSKDGAWRIVSSSRPSLTATFALTVCQKLRRKKRSRIVFQNGESVAMSSAAKPAKHPSAQGIRRPAARSSQKERGVVRPKFLMNISVRCGDDGTPQCESQAQAMVPQVLTFKESEIESSTSGRAINRL